MSTPIQSLLLWQYAIDRPLVGVSGDGDEYYGVAPFHTAIELLRPELVSHEAFKRTQPYSYGMQYVDQYNQAVADFLIEWGTAMKAVK